MPRRSSTRSRISPAALLVKVMAETWYGSTPRSETSQKMRQVMTRVLPEPAPASTSCGPSPWVTASIWSGLSWFARSKAVPFTQGSYRRPLTPWPPLPSPPVRRERGDGMRFTVKRPRFAVNAVRFAMNRTRFAVNRPRFVTIPACFAVNRTRFTVNASRFATNRPTFVTKRPAFAVISSRFTANPDPFTATRNPVRHDPPPPVWTPEHVTVLGEIRDGLVASVLQEECAHQRWVLTVN